jgi:hypothetical protein
VGVEALETEEAEAVEAVVYWASSSIRRRYTTHTTNPCCCHTAAGARCLRDMHTQVQGSRRLTGEGEEGEGEGEEEEPVG